MRKVNQVDLGSGPVSLRGLCAGFVFGLGGVLSFDTKRVL